MYSLYETFAKEKISFAYFGVFSDNITTMLIDLSESYLSKTEQLAKLSKKTSFLIAESFQNLVRHGIIEKNYIAQLQYNQDFYQISIIDEHIIITSANVIENKYVSELNDQINLINSLDKNELKLLKQELLTYGTLSEKGGAGLGLIEMVRKSGLPLKKEFLPLTDGYSLLLMGLEIKSNEKEFENNIDLKSTEIFYKKMVEDGVMMLYKGDFSNSSNSNLINMLHVNFLINGEIAPEKLKNIMAIIEVMQNVSKHAKSVNGMKEGIFAIKELNENLFIECSNFVNQEDYENLKETLKTIKSCTYEELLKLHKSKLANNFLSENGDAGMGLIELAKITHNTFSYYFVETIENEIFYSIKFMTI